MDLSVVVEFHYLNGSSALCLEMNKHAADPLIHPHKLYAQFTRKSVQHFPEIVFETLFAGNGAGRFAKEVYDKGRLEFDILAVVCGNCLRITPVPSLDPLVCKSLRLLKIHSSPPRAYLRSFKSFL